MAIEIIFTLITLSPLVYPIWKCIGANRQYRYNLGLNEDGSKYDYVIDLN